MKTMYASNVFSGSAVVSVTVVSSVASIVSKGAAYEGRNGKSSVSLYSSMLYATSSAVSGSPSWNVAPSTIVMVQVSPSSETDHSDASSDTYSPAGVTEIGVAYMSSYIVYESASTPLPGFRLSGYPPTPMRTVPPVAVPSPLGGAEASSDAAGAGVPWVVPHAASTRAKVARKTVNERKRRTVLNLRAIPRRGEARGGTAASMDRGWHTPRNRVNFSRHAAVSVHTRTHGRCDPHSTRPGAGGARIRSIDTRRLRRHLCPPPGPPRPIRVASLDASIPRGSLSPIDARIGARRVAGHLAGRAAAGLRSLAGRRPRRGGPSLDAAARRR